MGLTPDRDMKADNVPIWEYGQDGGNTRPINRDQLFINLCQVSDALTKYGIKHWLSHGTMLGAYRDNNFIAWDDDVDIGMDFSQRKLIGPAIEELEALGFFIPEGDPTKPITIKNTPYYDTVFLRDGEKIEGWWFERTGDHYIYDQPRCGNDLKHPGKYYDELQDFEFRGKTFKIPNHIEDYLVMMYGEGWNVPDENKKYNNQS